MSVVPPDNSRRWSGIVTAAAAVCALFIVVARAQIQSITVDEADTYLLWAALPLPGHWWPSANNHVLNSALIRLFTTLFGISHLSVRLPALIGAVIYMGSCFWLAGRIAGGWLRTALFVCLVCNPLVLDHMVAARGYSLALALFVAALAFAVYARSSERVGSTVLEKAAVACSICLGLSFAANFSFAIADAVLAACLFIWLAIPLAWNTRPPAERAIGTARLAAGFIVPGLAVAWVLAGPVAMRMGRQDIAYGAGTVREMFASIGASSLYQPNPYILNPVLVEAALFLQRFLIPLSIVAVLIAFGGAFWTRKREFRPAWLPSFGAVLAFAFAITFALHWLAARSTHFLPKDRTALFFVPLFTLLAGVVAAAAPIHFRTVVAAVLALDAIYFLGCLRLTYFREWKFDADMRQAYDVIAWYNHAYGVTDYASNWTYKSSLNFYLAMSGKEKFPPFDVAREANYPNARVYVLNDAEDRPVIAERNLQIVWRGPRSQAVVAILPGLDGAVPSAAQPR